MAAQFRALTSLALYSSHVIYLCDFLQKTPQLVALLEEIQQRASDVSFETWKETNKGVDARNISLPDSEVGKAKVSYLMLLDIAEGRANLWTYVCLVTHHGEFARALPDFTNIIVEPFINYLLDHLDWGTTVLYLLERYKHKVEWFQRDEIRDRYESDTKRGEILLDAHLREYLFDQGIDYPFQSPLSPSGRADVVAGLDGSDPLMLEIKIFHPPGYGKDRVRSGLRQIYDYCNDYNQSIGYLVVFNASRDELMITTAKQSPLWPARIELDYRTFYIVTIDLYAHDQPASKRKKIKLYEISEEYLASAIADDLEL